MHANNWAEMPPYFVTSATEATGKDDVLSYIEQINEDMFKANNEF
jgi:GTP-binding protein